MFDYFGCQEIVGVVKPEVRKSVDNYIKNSKCIDPEISIKDTKLLPREDDGTGYGFKPPKSKIVEIRKSLEQLNSTIHQDDEHTLANFQVHFLSRIVGLSDGDWNLSIFDDSRNDRERPDYQNGVHPISAHVDGYLFSHFVKNDLKLSLDDVEWTNNFVRQFGKNFQCVEDPALTPVTVSKEMRIEGCKIISERISSVPFRNVANTCETPKILYTSKTNIKKPIHNRNTNVIIDQNCLSCHANPEDGSTPQINFDDQDALISYALSEGLDADYFADIIRNESMPPRKKLSEEEKQKLVDYFYNVLGKAQ